MSPVPARVPVPRRAAALVLPLALVLATAACGGSDDTASPSSAAAAPTTAAPPAAAPGSAPAAGGGGELTAVVGETAFTIAMNGPDGTPVESIPAGRYTIKVQDPSKIHNIHLTGPGVDEQTSVPETAETTWTVDLQPGRYQYVCDPHPTMSAGFVVT